MIISGKGTRGGSRVAETSKMKHFVMIVNGFQPLAIIKKRSVLDVAAVLDLPLGGERYYSYSDSTLTAVKPSL